MKTTVNLLIILLSVLTHSLFAQYCKVALINKDDQLLMNLTQSDEDKISQECLKWAIPEIKSYDSINEVILYQKGFVTSFDTSLRITNWVSYELTHDEAEGGLSRLNCFRKDPRLGEIHSSTKADYNKSGLDRGHMAPNGDMSWDSTAMINSFILSNMTPQYPMFNRCIWAWLEGMVRTWTADRDSLFIITGTVFDYDADGKKDSTDIIPTLKQDNRVAIPSHLFKILIYEDSQGQLESLSFLLPNINQSPCDLKAEDYITSCITSIAHIEQLTNTVFIIDSGYSRRKVKRLKNYKAPKIWEGDFYFVDHYNFCGGNCW